MNYENSFTVFICCILLLNMNIALYDIHCLQQRTFDSIYFNNSRFLYFIPINAPTNSHKSLPFSKATCPTRTFFASLQAITMTTSDYDVIEIDKKILFRKEKKAYDVSKKDVDYWFHEYCVIGAGPAGLQMGYFLKNSGRDYVIFERERFPGAFFHLYPRHRRLISINKRFTGRSNTEFNMRHDWNSLLSDSGHLLFKHFSKKYFPDAGEMVAYLKTFARQNRLKIVYNIEIGGIRKEDANCELSARSSNKICLKNIKKNENDFKFSMSDQNGRNYSCRYLIVATGMSVPNSPKFEGSHLAEGYESMSLDPHLYEGKNVLILGRGNTAFETADALYGYTNFIHMVSRSRARLAWNTHYVGDLRAINNGLLDSYQLKSLDGLLETPVEEMTLEKVGDRIFVHFLWENGLKRQPFTSKSKETQEHEFDNFSLREGYDYVIRCLGFKFNFSLFHESTRHASYKRFPSIKSTYESRQFPNLFFAGTATHSLDYRRSSGGFIHGFRYTVRALHRFLEWRNHRVPWPSETHHIQSITNVIIKRVNEAAGTYQMYGELADIIILRKEKRSYTILMEFPVALLAKIQELTGHETGPLIVLMMEYGQDFSGPDKDTFREDRATGDPLEAHKSNFLHPVLYYYRQPPSESSMITKQHKFLIPKPHRLHHVLEDFLTFWTAQQTHILLLRRFLETITKENLRNYFGTKCLNYSLTTSSVPSLCCTLARTVVKSSIDGIS